MEESVLVRFQMDEAIWNKVVRDTKEDIVEVEALGTTFVVEYSSQAEFDKALPRFNGLIEYQVVETEVKPFSKDDKLEVIDDKDEDGEPCEGGVKKGEVVTMMDRSSEHRDFIIVERANGRQVQLEKRRFVLSAK